MNKRFLGREDNKTKITTNRGNENSSRQASTVSSVVGWFSRPLVTFCCFLYVKDYHHSIPKEYSGSRYSLDEWWMGNLWRQRNYNSIKDKRTTAPRLMVFFFINRLVSRGYLFRVVVLYLFILCLWKWKDWRLVFVFFSFLIRLVVPRGSLRIKIKKTLTACLHFSNTTKRCSQELISSVSISSRSCHNLPWKQY